MAYSRKGSSKRRAAPRRSARRAPAKRRSVGRRTSGGQTVRIVIEHAAGGGIEHLTGARVSPASKRRARF